MVYPDEAGELVVLSIGLVDSSISKDPCYPERLVEDGQALTAAIVSCLVGVGPFGNQIS